MVQVTQTQYSGTPLLRMGPWIVVGWVILTFIYVTLWGSQRYSRKILGFMPPPLDDLCQDSFDMDTCSRSDLFAFQMSSYWAIAACGLLGIYGWYVADKPVSLSSMATPQARLRQHHPVGEWLCAVNFTFQVWDFVVSLFIPEHATAVMLTHHTLAAIVSFCGLYFESLHYYAVFFLGLSEVSSMFLVFVDLSKYFPPREGSNYDSLVRSFCGPLFCVFFLYYRVIRWWPVSWQLWTDTRAYAGGRKTRSSGPPRLWLNRLFVSINLPLGLLQLYWATLILQEVYKVVIGGEEPTPQVLQDVN